MMETPIAQRAPRKRRLFTRNFVLAWAALSIAYNTILFTGLGSKPYIAQVMANLPFAKQGPQPLVPAWWEWPVVVPYELIDAIYQKLHFSEWISALLFLLVFLGVPIVVSFCVTWAGRNALERLSRQGQAHTSGRA